MDIRKIKIFLASSEELKEERDLFKIYISKKNDDLIEKGIYLDLQVWEHFFDAMSKTRLQDEYNRTVKESDIFIMLYFTKVGKYTEEEFDAAFGHFKENGKPLIYTYRKDSPISSASLNEEDTKSYFAFTNKLTALGHYQTTFRNTEGLLLHFESQLDKLIPKMQSDPGAVKKEQSRNGEEEITALINDLTSEKEAIQANAAACLLDYLEPAYISFHDRLYRIYVANLKSDRSETVNRLLVKGFEKAIRLKFENRDENNTEEIDITHMHLDRIKLPSKLNLRNADIAFSTLRYAILKGLNLEGVKGYKTDLSFAQLGGSNLHEARMQYAHFDNARLHNVKLTSADLKNAFFPNAEFFGAELQSAHFENADLRGANFTQANISDAYFQNAIFSPQTLETIKKTKLRENAHFDEKTRTLLGF